MQDPIKGHSVAVFRTDENLERLLLRDEEVDAGDGETFDVLASSVDDVNLSELPLGIRVQLCDRVVGSRDFWPREPCAVFEHASSGGLVAHLSVPIIPESEDSSEDTVREFFAESLEAGERALEPLRQQGRLLSVERAAFDEIAFLEFTITLFDQTFSEAEAFVASIEQRVSGARTPPKLFVCHASEDRPFVDRLVTELDRRALYAWYDKREILVGDSIVEKINTALASSDFLVAVLSPRSVAKPWVVRELSSTMMRQLRDAGISVLPVLQETCDVPSLLSDIKYADFSKSFDEGIADLVRAIRERKTT